MAALSPDNEKRVSLLFPSENRDEAIELLEKECAGNLTLHPELLERIQVAAIKASGGSIERLVDVIVLAQTDWRDLLVGAGLADDPKAHLKWWPEPRTS